MKCPLPPRGVHHVKVICPHCTSTEVKAGKTKHFVCAEGHEFDAGDALVTLNEAMVLGKALNHPLRRRVLLQFRDTPELSAVLVSKAIGEPLSNVAYHVKVLFKANVLIPTKKRQRRGAEEKFYRVNPSATA